MTPLQIYMGVGWLGWLTIVAAVAGVVMFRDAETERTRRLGSASWGVLLAGLLYLVYQHYTAADVASLAAYLAGDGLVWVVLSIIAFGGYIADRTAGETDDPAEFVNSVREAAFVPVERAISVALGSVISVVMILLAFAGILGEFFGFGIGLFASEPGFGFGIFATLAGFVGLGGEIPLVTGLFPKWVRSMSPMEFVGVAGAALVIALSLASSNFRTAMLGGER